MAGIGQTLLLLLLVLSAWCAAMAILAARRRDERLLVGAEYLTYAVAAAATAAMAILTYAFAVSDFSLTYVQQHSERSMPLFYRITSVWGGQEGSLLVWAWMLGLLGALAVRRNRYRLREMLPHTIAVLMGVMLFFAVLLVTASNPFLPFLVEVPTVGKGLNPLLQNPYMVSHPPALYLGFTGMAIPFAFAFGALLSRQSDDSWTLAALPWVRFAWYFLALGLALGMLWAYEELGWGGYWGWDPVENAALFPWLTCTALLHSLTVQRQRGMFRGWTALLALLSFVLTIFGTFLTRSGFIESVHAFSRSNIGYVFLAFIALVLLFGSGVILWRRRRLRGRHRVTAAMSREMWLLMNNWVLLVATLLVLVLTIFPTISEIFGPKRKIEPAAFNLWMAPVGIGLLLLTAICPLLGWRRTAAAALRRQLMIPLGVALAVAAALLIAGVRHPLALLVWSLGAMVFASVSQEVARALVKRAGQAEGSVSGALRGLITANRSRYGGYVVHLGVALMCIGFAGEAFKTERQVALQRGQRARVGDYTLRHDGLRQEADAEKRMLTATITVFGRGGDNLGTIEPAIWTFFRRPSMPTSEVGLRRGLMEDLFVALGNADPSSGAATFKLVINPLVNWIWIGFLVLTLGAAIAQIPAWGRRRRRRRLRALALADGRRQPMSLIAFARWTLPLGFLGLGVVGGLRGGGIEGATFAGVAGATLGSLLYYLLCAIAVILGHLPSGQRDGVERSRPLELDRQLIARSVRDIELDHDLGKLDRQQADELATPLRERLRRLELEIDRAAGEADPLAREILALVDERLDGPPVDGHEASE